MLLKDIDKILDMECRIIFNKDDRAFSLSKATGHTFQGSIDSKGGERILSVFIPKMDTELDNKSINFLTQTAESEGFLVATLQIEKSIFDLLSSLNKVDSTTSFNITIEKGQLTVRFRFHHKVIPQISEVLTQYDILKHLVKELNLFPSTGFIEHLDIKNKESPIHVLEYAIPFSLLKNKAVKSEFENGAIAEVVSDLSDSKDHGMIIYGKKNSKSGLKPIAVKSNIYEVPLDVGTLNVILNLFNAEGIKRHNIFYRKVGDDLRVVTFLERSYAMKHISESFAFYSRLKIPVSLTLSMDYGSEIWELF